MTDSPERGAVEHAPTVEVAQPLPFGSDWQALLRSTVGRAGQVAIPGAIDYFAFSRGLFDPVPPFAIGRFEWDQWLLYRARARGAPIIDATVAVLAVHQNHGDEYLARLPPAAIEHEIARNRWLALFHRLDLRDATHALTGDGLVTLRGAVAAPAPVLRSEILPPTLTNCPRRLRLLAPRPRHHGRKRVVLALVNGLRAFERPHVGTADKTDARYRDVGDGDGRRHGIERLHVRDAPA